MIAITAYSHQRGFQQVKSLLIMSNERKKPLSGSGPNVRNAASAATEEAFQLEDIDDDLITDLEPVLRGAIGATDGFGGLTAIGSPSSALMEESVASPGSSSTASGPTYVRVAGFKHHAHEFTIESPPSSPSSSSTELRHQLPPYRGSSSTQSSCGGTPTALPSSSSLSLQQHQHLSSDAAVKKLRRTAAQPPQPQLNVEFSREKGLGGGGGGTKPKGRKGEIRWNLTLPFFLLY